MLLRDLKSFDPYFSNYILCKNLLCSSKSIIFLVFSSGLCIFSNRKLQLVRNYVLKMVIIFAFCMISLPKSSRYVLIDFSNLTHFLCLNLFVMSFLIP